MKYMQCTTCKRTVYQNDIGTCLGCQKGFSHADKEDVWQKKSIDISDILEPNYERLYEYPKLEDEV